MTFCKSLSVFAVVYALAVPPLQANTSPAQSTDLKAEKTASEKLKPVKHIIVFYLENHSFDNLFGTFPGADGISQAGAAARQVDAQGKPYAILPPVLNAGRPDTRFPDRLPNKPFPITDYVGANAKTGDLNHRFYQLQAQINGGKMDRFALLSEAGGLTMGYYPEGHSPLWYYAKRFTLADHFFTGAFGGSMLNHLWLVCACTPRYDSHMESVEYVSAEEAEKASSLEQAALEKLTAKLDDQGHLLKDGALTSDRYAVNTMQPFFQPFDPRTPDAAMRLPPLLLPTIGDRLNEKHIGWAWYSGGWKDALAGHPDPSFQFHHQPFVYFAAYGPQGQLRAQHLKDEADFVQGIEQGDLPAVSFYKPLGKVNLHPGYADLEESEAHVFGLLRKIEQSTLWKDSLIVITFDDAGGWWDHVAPPKGDRFGPGERVPTLVISPFARQGFIDHSMYDTTSILKLIETKYDLKPLGERDAKSNDLTNALE